MTPQRIQRKRTRSWTMPAGAVYVGRPSKWGNDFKIGDPDPVEDRPMTAADAVRHFESALAFAPDESIAELRGKDLACWCKIGDPCHADVLLRLANS